MEAPSRRNRKCSSSRNMLGCDLGDLLMSIGLHRVGGHAIYILLHFCKISSTQAFALFAYFAFFCTKKCFAHFFLSMFLKKFPGICQGKFSPRPDGAGRPPCWRPVHAALDSGGAQRVVGHVGAAVPVGGDAGAAAGGGLRTGAQSATSKQLPPPRRSFTQRGGQND